ncbi:hypothetical protein SY88_20980 [Clostridiales bacterium PH28_bin88]|nr:hypothetical protein SY88_20980 [Clostridiales bacterium PH28_bin88]
MRILLLGFTARALAEAAAAAGYDAVSLDYFGDYDLQRLIPAYSLRRDWGTGYSAENLWRASERLNWEAAVYASDLENHPPVVARLAGKGRLLGNGPGELAVRDRRRLQAALGRGGILFPRSTSRLPESGGDRWLVKPEKSGGGRGVAFWQPGQPVPPGAYWQRFIPGTPVSAAFVANGAECVVLGVTEQFSGGEEKGGFAYRGNVVPFLPPEKAERAALLAAVRRFAAFLTREFGLKGLNGMDLIYHEQRLYLLEVNPRYSASMELLARAYRPHLFRDHVDACLTGRLPRFYLEEYWEHPPFYGKRVVYARCRVRVPVRREAEWRRAGVRDIPRGGERIPPGSPVCTVLAAADSRGECLARLDGAEAWIRSQLEKETGRWEQQCQ